METREDRLSPTYDSLAREIHHESPYPSHQLDIEHETKPHKPLGIRQHLELFASTMAVDQAEQSTETTDAPGSAAMETLPNFDDSCA